MNRIALQARPHWPITSGVLLVIALSFAVSGSTLSDWFTGVDVFPLILSNRVGSFTEVFELFSRISISHFNTEVLAAPPSVRPVGQLIFALDFWVWGLNPFGYHLTNILIHTLTSVLIIFLARELHLRQWKPVGVTAAALFATHPVHGMVVPHIETRYDMLLGAFTLIALIMSLKFLSTGSRRYLALTLIAGGFALGSKETAVLTFPIIAVLAVYMRTAGNTSVGTAALLVGLWGLITVGFLGYRWWVVGDTVGGYPARSTDFDFMWRLSLDKFFNPLVPFLPHLQDSPARRLARLLMLGSIFLMALAALWGVYRYGLGRTSTLLDRVERYIGVDFRQMTLFSCWILLLLAFYFTISVRTAVFQAWYMYVPTIFFTLLLTVIFFTAVRVMKDGLAKRGPGTIGASAAGVFILTIALILVFQVISILSFKQVEVWSIAGDLGRDYLYAVQKSASGLPQGSTVFLVNMPHGILCVELTCLGNATMFEDYSVDAWMELAEPGRDIDFVAVSAVLLTPEQLDTVSHWSYDQSTREATVQITEGAAEPPWRTRSGLYMETEFEKARPSKSVKIQITNEQILAGSSYYFFDFFRPEQVLSLSQDGLVQTP